MTDSPSSITPTDQLVQQWINNAHINQPNMSAICREVATKAIQWSWDQRGAATEAELQQRADQELEACCECLNKSPYGASLAVNGVIEQLRAARRPKPPSLKEQALNTLDEMSGCMRAGFIPKRSDLDTIRQALEALPND